MRDWRILKTQVLGAGCALRLPTAVTRSVAGRPYDSAFTQHTIRNLYRNIREPHNFKFL